jgi:hypothetical protein
MCASRLLLALLLVGLSLPAVAATRNEARALPPEALEELETCCEDDEPPPLPSPAKFVVLPPEAPRSCQTPTSAVMVSNVAQLEAALGQTTAQDIWLASGTYSPSSVLTTRAAHRLWGAHADAVTIQAGVNLGSNWGGISGFEIHCLTFEVVDASLVHNNAIVSIWGSHDHVGIFDSRLISDFSIGRAVNSSKSNGLHGERIEIAGFNSDGIRIQNDGGEPAVLTDLDIRDIELPGPDDRDGTAEAGIFMRGKGRIERVKIRAAYWMGIGTYADDLVIRDLDVDGSLHAVYLEHYTRRLLLERFYFGPDNRTGITYEWDDPQRYSGAPTTVDTIVQDGLIEAYRVGIAIMDGQLNPTIRRVVFRNQCGIAIVAGRARVVGEVLKDNDFLGIRSNALAVASTHPNTMKCT